MSLHETIKNQSIEAMRARDIVRLETLRGLIALFSNELIAKKSSAPFLDDESASVLIKRSVKQHQDSIEQFEKGGRKDLVKKESAELKILKAFLPAMMSRDEIKKFIETKKIPKENSGKFIGEVMKELKGRADGALVKVVIDEMVK